MTPTRPIPDGDWRARLEGGPYDGHQEDVDETPDHIEVGECEYCECPHVHHVGNGPHDAEAYSLAEVTGYTARYEWTMLNTILDDGVKDEKLIHA